MIAIELQMKHSGGQKLHNRRNTKGHPRVAFRKKMSGGVLLSHAVTRAVPSTLKGLASGFGMEPGVSPSL